MVTTKAADQTTTPQQRGTSAIQWSELGAQHRASFNAWTGQRQDQLLKQIDDAANRGLQFMALVNGGSAAVLAAFMGTSAQVQASPEAWFAQKCFLVKIVAIGFAFAARFHFLEALFNGVKADTLAVYQDELDPEDIPARDDRRAKHMWLVSALDYLSFGAFIVGAITAAYSLPGTLTPLNAAGSIDSKTEPVNARSAAK